MSRKGELEELVDKLKKNFVAKLADFTIEKDEFLDSASFPLTETEEIEYMRYKERNERIHHMYNILAYDLIKIELLGKELWNI